MTTLAKTISAEEIVAASYERVSTRLQGTTGFSLGAQDKDAAAFALEHNWQLPDHLRFRDGEDRAASGADWELEGLMAAMDSAKRHDYQVLIVPDPDRFARNMVKALVLEEQLRKYGVRVVYIRMPLEDTAEGRLLKHQLFSIAEYEREKITFRTARGRREKAERGIVVGAGPAPYGYRYVRTGERLRISGVEPDPLTAPIVQSMYRDALRQPLKDIRRRLVDENAPTPRHPWTVATLHRILTNPTYAGRFVYGGRGRKRARVAFSEDLPNTVVNVPPLVERKLWDAVQIALTSRRTRARPTPDARADDFILRGLLKCGVCGGGLSAAWNNGAGGRQTTRYYQCIRNEPHKARLLGKPLCTLRSVRADQLEALVWEVVSGTLLDPLQLRRGIAAARADHDLALVRQSDRRAAIEREIERTRDRIRRVLEELLDVDRGSESHAMFTQRREVLEQTLNRLRAELDEVATAQIGLSPEDAAMIEVFAASADIRHGVELAGGPTQRQIYEHLRLSGSLRMAEDGIQIGTKHRFDIDLSASLALGDQLARLKNKVTIYPKVVEFLRLHLVGESGVA